MSQNFITNTTSFIISSDESLNKPSLSLGHSTGSSSISSKSSNDNMTTSDSTIHDCNLYFTSLKSASNNMVHNQQKILHPSVHPPPPPSYALQQGQIYGALNGMEVATNISPNTTTPNCQQQIIYGHVSLNLNHSNGDSVQNDSMIDTIYEQASTHKTQDINSRSNTLISNNQELARPCSTYSSDNLPASYPVKTNDQHRSNTSTLNCLTIDDTLNNSDAKFSHVKHASTYSPKSNNSVQTFQNHNQIANNQRNSINYIDTSTSSHLMPINVKGMLLHGVSGNEVLNRWLSSIDCGDYLRNFLDNGYDMPLITRMTPQDLTAIGCKSPILRKKLLTEIKKLNIDDDIPERRPGNLERWLELLKLREYYKRLCDEGYSTIDKVCELTWEDLEEIGINKLGHQKRLLLGIERLKKYEKLQEERQNDFAIYDVHPNHKVSLNQNLSEHRHSTLGRSTVRSGFFQTRSGANLDHRGLPIATVVPALKHVTNPTVNLDIFNHVTPHPDGTKTISSKTDGFSNEKFSSMEQNGMLQSVPDRESNQNSLRMSDLTTTIKRNPPPLPPVRTNSLKIPEENSCTNYHSNSIYGSSYGVVGGANGRHYTPMASSTSFLRTPKLGALTATTNKMLTLGGHIQSVNGQLTTALRSMPVREAPLPPVSAAPSAIPDKIDEEPNMGLHGFNDLPVVDNVGNEALMSQSSIRHQLASADEFPPPPPSE